MASIESATENVTIQTTSIDYHEDRPNGDQDENKPVRSIMATFNLNYLIVNHELQLIGENLSRIPKRKNISLFREYTVLQNELPTLCYTIMYQSPTGSDLLLSVSADRHLVLEPMPDPSGNIEHKYLFVRHRCHDGSGLERIESWLYKGMCLVYYDDQNIVDVSEIINTRSEASQFFYVFGLRSRRCSERLSPCFSCCFRRKKKRTIQVEDSDSCFDM